MLYERILDILERSESNEEAACRLSDLIEMLDKPASNGMKADEIDVLVREEAIKKLVSAAHRIREKTAIDDIRVIDTAHFVQLLVQEVMAGGPDGE